MIKFDKRLLQRMRVPLGFVFAAVFLVAARPGAITIAVGAGVSLIGLLIRGWASGHIRKGRELAVSGPYAYTRNPLYLGSFILGVGFAIASGVWWLALVFIVLFLGIYLPVMNVEADDIRRIFGEDFDEYERNVPAFVPRFTPWRKTGEKFDFRLYLQYREYRAGLGLLIAVGVLIAKLCFLN
jgi:protein-S-isoprenylcysteine O-methyltransferase Ste14